MNAHIYLVTNNINQKQYVGQTTIDNNKNGHGSAINHAYKLYGKSNFNYEKIFTKIDNRNLLNYAEKFWIEVMGSLNPNGYNIEKGGSGKSDHRKGLPAWNKGLKTPENVRMKQSLAKAGKTSPRKGIPHSEETKAKVSLTKKGIRLSDEVYKRQALSRTGYKHEIVTCPHCGKSGGITAMPRWHFNNCKEKK